MSVKKDKRGIKGVGYHRKTDRPAELDRRRKKVLEQEWWEETVAMVAERAEYFWSKPHRERLLEGDFRFGGN